MNRNGRQQAGSSGWTALALAALISLPARGADLADQARGVLKENQDSLITITSLSKLDTSGSGLPIQISGLGDAQESSCNGVVVDASGLTVVSYSALNPMEKMAGAIQIKISGGEGDDNAVKAKAELSRIQMRLDDGTEVPARLVMKDKELDLAFLLPDPKDGDKAPALSPVKLAADATAKVLDDVVAISRHSKELGSQPIVDLGRVTSVLAKPRPMYDLSVNTRLGSPIFLSDGRLLGVVVSAGGGGHGMISLGQMEALVLPAADIIKLAGQAKEAAAKAAKKE